MSQTREDEVEIVRFTADRADECSALIHRVLDAAPPESFTPTSLEGNRTFYRPEELVAREGERWRTFLALSGGRVVGTISLCLTKHWLYGLWVDPGEQGRGVGRRLVGALIEEARAAGVPILGVFSVMPSVAFYDKLGFRAVHHHDSEEYGELEEMKREL